MLKGAQKQMIVVKTAENRFFEEAYFVIRPNAKADGEDMVSEAYKVIDACTDKKREKRDRGAKKSIRFCSILLRNSIWSDTDGIDSRPCVNSDVFCRRDTIDKRHFLVYNDQSDF